jgi:hypothetical protein
MKMRLTTFLVLAVASLGCAHRMPGTPALTKIERIDPDTNLRETYTAYRDDRGEEVQQGGYVMWYNNGSKYIEANYDRGELDGKCLIYSDDGKLQVEGWYRHGKPWSGTCQIGEELHRYSWGVDLGKQTD